MARDFACRFWTNVSELEKGMPAGMRRLAGGMEPLVLGAALAR
jgi:hypothetical protein